MVAEGIVGTIATQGFAGMLGNLASSYISKPGRRMSERAEVIKTDFSDHLRNTFEKCTKIKTILNANVASDTLSIYVDQRFRRNEQEIDQYDLVTLIKNGGAYIISGTGGGGKSMFMRYLWLSFFEDPRGRIPFFLELRNLNSVTHKNLEDFIFHSIVKSGSTISQNNFQNALKAGEFVLFLDGFDEINFDKRDALERTIIELRENNPKITMVLTSRPDERFSGWTLFDIIDVLPLSKAQAISLIKRAPYDDSNKSLFLSKFDTLYKNHEGFLSTPLLAYMMLVTFAFNPDIPNRMFLFYEQAFEALYHRHDLTKSYKRQFHCSMEKQSFIRLLSFLCLKTYYEERYEFTSDELRRQVEDVKLIEGVSEDTDAFIKDLIESVCMFKVEGLMYTFTHRSFQEYFSAYCISRVAIRNIEKLFAEFSNRYSDSVMRMVYDINPDLYREKYIIPLAKKYSALLSRKTSKGLYESVASHLGQEFEIRSLKQGSRRKPPTRRTTPERRFAIVLRYVGEMKSFFENIRRISNDWDPTVDRLTKDEHARDTRFAERLVQVYGKSGDFECVILVRGKKICVRATVDDVGIDDFDDDGLVARFKTTGMYNYVVREVEKFISTVNAEIAAYNSVSKAFRELF